MAMPIGVLRIINLHPPYRPEIAGKKSLKKAEKNYVMNRASILSTIGRFVKRQALVEKKREEY